MGATINVQSLIAHSNCENIIGKGTMVSVLIFMAINFRGFSENQFSLRIRKFMDSIL